MDQVFSLRIVLESRVSFIYKLEINLEIIESLGVMLSL
jgi:hypothetical protein